MSKHADNPILIGYSGHAFTVMDALLSAGRNAAGYCDLEEKQRNPFALGYLGQETSEEAMQVLRFNRFFVSIGDNQQRERLSSWALRQRFVEAAVVSHTSATVSPSATLGDGTLVGANAAINALATIGRGVIINTGAIVEHESQVGAFSHIAPGAVLLGNVTVGRGVLIGANAVVFPGLTIGDYCVIGAGSLVRKDLPAGSRVAGNPARNIG